MPPQSQSDAQGFIQSVGRWRLDATRFVRDNFHIEPDAWQLRALEAASDPKQQRIALQACVGPGKTAVLAWLGWWFVTCFSDGTNHPQGACLAVDGANLKANLWKELAHWRDQSQLLQDLFEMTAEAIMQREYSKTWKLEARTWSKSASQDEQGRSLSGLHAKAILYLIDEAGDINPAVLRAAEQGLSNCAWGKIILAGNPTSLDGMLYTATQTQSHLWTVVPITGDPDDPTRSPRIDRGWASEQIRLYGRDNPWVMYSILGKFPPSSLNAWLGPDEVQAAMGRHLRVDEYSYAQMRLGIDCARFGDDSTVIFPRQGLASFSPVEMRNARGTEISTKIAEMKVRHGSEMEFIDDTGGYGSSPIDAALLAGVALVPVHASSKADDPRFFNKRAENTFRACQWVKSGGAFPNISRLKAEAVAASQYTIKDGKFLVLEKSQIKVNLHGQSPDYWDAFCLTFDVVEMPGRMAPAALFGGARGRSALSEYDPLADDRFS